MSSDSLTAPPDDHGRKSPSPRLAKSSRFKANPLMEPFHPPNKLADDDKVQADPRKRFMETKDGVFSMSGSLVARTEFDSATPSPVISKTSSFSLSGTIPAPVLPSARKPRSPIASPRDSPRGSPYGSPAGSPLQSRKKSAPSTEAAVSLRHSNRALPKRKNSSAGDMTSREKILVPFEYKGHLPCVLTEQIIAVGEAMIRGSEVAVVEVEGMVDGNDDVDDEVVGYHPAASSGEEEGGGNYLAEDDSRSEKEEEEEEQVLVLVWEGTDGVLEEWCVEPGDTIEPGTIIARVQLSARLAHLIQADQYAQQLRIERTDWGSGVNARFQNLTEKLVRAIASGSREVVHSPETLTTCSDLERVARDFMDTARTYGKVIISEIHLPVESKTVRPLKLGGVLGGSKYVVRDVLFKLGDGQVFSDYPDPLYIANKIQGHELKGLRAYFSTFFNQGTLGMVSFPMMAVIDYRGHRITAMSELPISGRDSLILGSMNAGSECDVMDEDPAFTSIVNDASKALGLRSHWVNNGVSRGGETEIAFCVDLEGHLGRDGRKYLLDFSRTFPPVCKNVEKRAAYDKHWPFYHMFRSEFLARYQEVAALSPDAFSMFQSARRPEEKKQRHAEIREATVLLKSQVVHNVCVALQEAFKGHEEGSSSMSLAHTFHREGLNMRYLGLVYHKLVSTMYSQSMRNVYKELIAESMMRVLKRHLRFRLRQADGESNQLAAAKEVLNAFFGRAADELEWVQSNPFVMDALEEDFNFTKQNARHAVVTFRSTSTLRTNEGEVLSVKFVVLKRLTEATGLDISAEVMMDLKTSTGEVRGRAFDSETVFEDLDFTFSERVKQLDVIQRAFGLAQYLKGVRVMNENPASAEQFFLRGFFMVEKVLERSPLDPWLMALMGDLSSSLWMIMNAQCLRTEQILAGGGSVGSLKALQEAKDLAAIFSTRAERYYQDAVAASPVVSVLRNYAVFLLRHARVDEAEEHLNKAMNACNNEGGTLDGQLLSEWELVAELQDLLKECEDVRNGGVRKSSVQFSGSASLAPSAQPSTGHNRRDSLSVSIGTKLKRSLRRQGKSPSGGLRKSGRVVRASVGDGDAVAKSRHVSAPGIPRAIVHHEPASQPERLHRDDSAEGALAMAEELEKEEKRLASGRNRALLSRLKGATQK